ncbi:GPI transamidase component PIG-S [Schistocerca piceifrons]|uniref:GPI transamidase component PIG-S n=1 Tax=Schistocerca piceifrons TaxID=274613 RepID=UPI001F5FC9D4|nr:GPI transamidase component PIG-S [Schistocerca piceifrons]
MTVSSKEGETSRGGPSQNNKISDKKDNDAIYRVYSALSFFFMLIVVGFPLWWKTTEVHRESLPYTEISSLNDLKLSFHVNAIVSTLDKSRGEDFIRELNKLFRTSEIYNINFTWVAADKALLGSMKSITDLELSSISRLRPGEIKLLEIPGLSRFSPDQILVGQRRSIYFSTDASPLRMHDVLHKWLLQEETLVQTMKSLSSQTGERDYTSRYRLPPAEGYNLLVTAVNPDPESLNTSHWDLPQAVSDYITPFLDKLSTVANFSLRSQWIYLTPLEIRPRRAPEGGFVLDAESLPQLITPLEKKLASHVSNNPCIQLLVYVPLCSESPLRLLASDQSVSKYSGLPGYTMGFHSPRWGGLVLQNPTADACTGPQPVLVNPDWPSLAAIWLQQLRSLIGIPEHAPIARASIMPEPQSAVRLWEVDALMRIRALEQLLSARLTLQSLSALLEEISNIVIGKDVAEAVEAAVEGLHTSVEHLARGNLARGLSSARNAFLQAEAAFTDPSLLSLLYFPDDQKYAVYIPLFLPVMIPVVMSLRKMKTWISVLRTEKLKVE